MNQEIENKIREGEMLGRYLANPEESGEQENINEWLKKDAHRKLLEEITTPEFVHATYKFHQSVDPRYEFELFRQKRRRNRLHRLLPYLSVAAVVAMVLIITLLYPDKTPVGQSPVNYAGMQIQPGSSKAILVLEDNRQIELNSSQNQISRDGKIIADLNEAHLTYRKAAGEKAGSKPAWHRLITPVGGEYHLTLSDGTKVWLNANSELSYPVSFTDNSREVRLHGEAYFEVFPDKNKSFRVHSDKFDIVVTGTAFNVTAYPEEQYHRVALVRGGVDIMSGTKLLTSLVPGKQIDYNVSDNRFAVSNADLEAITAWKEGLFLFREETLSSITRKLGRWYNVKFKLQGNTEGKFYSGTIKRDETLQNTLNILRLTNEIDFNMKNNEEIEVISIP